jgi:hypothetical protein
MAYLEKYPVGTVVKIGSLEWLRALQGEWKFHHPSKISSSHSLELSTR